MTSFYADDKNDEIDAVRTHGFGRLEPARFVRLRVSTDLRWIGHDEKCFRLELLGCRSGQPVSCKIIIHTCQAAELQ